MTDDPPIEARPVILVNIVDASDAIIAASIMEYEAEDFLRLRVSPEVAAGCKVVRVSGEDGGGDD